MADFNPTIENIDENIVPSNHARSITGAKLNSVLKGMINDVNDKKEDTIADLPSIRSGAQQGASAYQLPSSGIPMTDLSDGVKTSLNKADTALQSENLAPYRIAQAQDLIDQTLAGMVGEKYTKPSDGIPKTDLASGVQTSLEKADSALQEHQDISGKMDKVTGDTEGNLAILDSNGNVTDSNIASTDIITEVKTINGTPVKGSGNITIPTDGEVVIVDSLDSDSSTSALSAKQGKELKNATDVNKVELRGGLQDISSLFTFVNGKGIKSNGDSMPSGVNSATIEYVDISSFAGRTMKIIMSLYVTYPTTTPGLAFYDSNKTLLFFIKPSEDSTLPSASFEERTIAIPQDAHYLRTTLYTSKMSNFYAKIVHEKDYLDIVDTLSNEVLDISKDISLLFRIDDGYSIKTNDGVASSSSVNSANIEYADISAYRGQVLRITLSKYAEAPSILSGLAFYDSQKHFISGYPGRTDSSLPEATLEERAIIIPYNAVYARTTVYTRLVDSFYAKVYKKGLEKKIRSITHEVPQSVGVLNCVKRARQLTDIRWTPIKDLPRLCSVTRDYSVESDYYEGVFKQGVEYRGIPYGRAMQGAEDYGYADGRVGQYISVDTFASSVSNEGTALNEISEYSGANHESTFYAVTCNGLVSYALGIAQDYTTAQYPSIPGMNKIEDISDIDINLLNLGDVILRPSYHVAIITDLIRDDDDNVIFIEVSEATTAGAGNRSLQGDLEGGVARRKGWSVNEFKGWFRDYAIYRYAYIDVVGYVPSRFVNVGDELDIINYSQMPCLPYMGEGFVYKVGYIEDTRILIESRGFSYLQVIKDGEKWNIDGTQNAYEIGADDFVDIGFTEAGKYEAYLCNKSEGEETISTLHCHWSVNN